MSERKYSVSEIDALRHAVETKYLYGSYSLPRQEIGPQAWASCTMSRSYREGEKVAAVEQMVRTHMLAGHTAEDLYASERPLPKGPVT